MYFYKDLILYRNKFRIPDNNIVGIISPNASVSTDCVSTDSEFGIKNPNNINTFIRLNK